MKVLVTGVAGFIGNELALQLLQRGDEVLGIDNMSDYYEVQLKKDRLHRLEGLPGFEFKKIDMSDKESFAKAYQNFKPDRVASMAAQPGVRYSLEHPDKYIQSNIVGFMNLLELCRHEGTEHLVYASSSSVYGGNTLMPFSEHHSTEHPVSLYAATKKSNEMMAHSYSHLFDIPSTGLRFFTVYGPWGRPDMATFKFTNAIVNGLPIDVYNNGHHKRDFTFVSDIVEGIVRVIDKPPAKNSDWSGNSPDPASSSAPYRVYNIGNHSPVLLSEFVETLEKIIGKEANKVYKEMQPGDVPDTFADCSELKKDFGYHPDTPLSDGLASFYDWYKSYY